jgi:hypothetical protein
MRKRLSYEARVDELVAAINDCTARIRATRPHLSPEDRLLLQEHLAALRKILKKWQRARKWYLVRNFPVGSPSESNGVRAQRQAVISIRTILKAARRRPPNP